MNNVERWQEILGSNWAVSIEQERDSLLLKAVTYVAIGLFVEVRQNRVRLVQERNSLDLETIEQSPAEKELFRFTTRWTEDPRAVLFEAFANASHVLDMLKLSLPK